MFVVFVSFFKFVICFDFFSHAKYIFTFCNHNFVFFFLKGDPETVKASGLIKPGPTRVHVSVWTRTCTRTMLFIVCLSPSVLCVLFWSHTTCTCMMPFIMVYHLQYSVLFWSCTTCTCTMPFIMVCLITFSTLCFVLISYNMQTYDDVHDCLFTTFHILCFIQN